jgi:hypothetical protein
MTQGGDLRSVLRPRSAVRERIQRLIAATEHAEPVTLSARDAATLLTFIEAATRIAERATDRQPAVHADLAEINSLQYQLQKTTEAWEASERALWRKDLEAL